MRTRTSWSLGGSTSTSHTSQRLGDSNSSAARDFTCPPLHMPDGLILEPPRPGRSPDDDPEMIAGDNQLAAKHCDTGHHAVLTNLLPQVKSSGKLASLPQLKPPPG